MNDNSQTDPGNRVMGPVIGFALGAVVGGALALLLAPESGERTRRRLGVNARLAGRDVGHSIDEVRARVSQAVTGIGADVKAAVDAGRGAFQREVAARDERRELRIATDADHVHDGQV
jgi:gas vesicle protein